MTDKVTKHSGNEGPRGFSVLIQELDEGGLHSELSAKVQEICAELAAHSAEFSCDAKGELTLKIGLKVQRNGTVAVATDVTSKTPKRKRAESVFWLTKSNNLVSENPKQTKLNLREVPKAAEARDVQAETGTARSV